MMSGLPSPTRRTAGRLPRLRGRAGRLPGLPTGLLVVLVGALAGGCAAPPPVIAAADSPTSGPSARLLLRGNVPADDRYAAFVLTDALACKNPRLLIAGTNAAPPPAGSLPAGVLTTLDFAVIRAGQPRACGRLSFTPVAGKTYLLRGAVAGAGCQVQLLDATAPDRPQPVADAVPRANATQPCLPLAEAQAARAARSGGLQGGQHAGEAVLNPHASSKDLEGLIRP